MNHSICKVRAGQTTADFNIRLPLWATPAVTSSGGFGKPRYLLAANDDVGEEIVASAGFYLTTDTTVHSFLMKTGLGSDENTPPKMVDKWASHDSTIEQLFPHLQSLPRLDYAAEQHLLAFILPPYTSVHTTDGILLDLMGFEEYEESEEDVGGRGKSVGLTKCFGYVNDTNHLKYILAGTELLPGETLRSQLGNNETLPLTVRWVLQTSAIAEFFVTLPRKIRTTPDELRTAHNYMMERATLALNLKTSWVEVNVFPGTDQLEFVGRSAGEGANAVLTLVLGDEVAKALDLERTRELVFPLETGRSYTIRAPALETDPFAGNYPVTVMRLGSGKPLSWIDGMGYVSVVGILREKGKQMELAEAVGQHFDSDNSVMTLVFLDPTMKKIEFRHDFVLTLISHFIPPPLISGKPAGNLGWGH
jgi:hypothetical protein